MPISSSPRLLLSSLVLPGLVALSLPACKSSPEAAATDLKTARAGFATHLLKQESEQEPVEPAPAGVCDLVKYTSPAGELAAYISKDPKDGARHPLVIWITGGFSNSISPDVWEDDSPVENDQSAGAYRRAGLAMMYPSFRGGNDNPGHKEGLYGEVDDVLAAAEYAAKLPWVDPQRIYLGGHSTGGTLALLTAEAAGDNRFRAVIAFGAVDSVSGYGQENLPYDVHDSKETNLRAPVKYLASVKSPTLLIEGDKGNADSLKELQRKNKNPNLSFTLATGYSHFSVLAPANAVLAKKLQADTNPTAKPDLTLSAAEISAASGNLSHPR